MSKDGVHRRYEVRRTDGSSDPGKRHEFCSYFVLDLACDPHAITALKAYAKACRQESPELAADLDHIIANRSMRCGCREACCPHSLARAFGPNDHSEMAAYIMGASERDGDR